MQPYPDGLHHRLHHDVMVRTTVTADAATLAKLRRLARERGVALGTAHRAPRAPSWLLPVPVRIDGRRASLYRAIDFGWTRADDTGAIVRPAQEPRAAAPGAPRSPGAERRHGLPARRKVRESRPRE